MKNIVLHLDELNQKLVYLASPYSHAYPEVRECRYVIAREAAAILLRLGVYAFSPIAYSHRLITGRQGRDGWRDWAGFDLAMLAVCDALCVLQESGWQESEGVKAEIEVAEQTGKPIYYARLNELFVALSARDGDRSEVEGELPADRVAVRDSEKPPPVG